MDLTDLLFGYPCIYLEEDLAVFIREQRVRAKQVEYVFAY
jgi:hypothetical protein